MPRIKDWAVRVADSDSDESPEDSGEAVRQTNRAVRHTDSVCTPDGQAVREATIISHLTDSSFESVTGIGTTTNAASPRPSRVEKQEKANQSKTTPAAHARAQSKNNPKSLAELIDEGTDAESEYVTPLICPTGGCQKIPARAGELCWLCKSNAAKAAIYGGGSLIGTVPEL
jgi:hypothetical protein